MAEDPRRLLLRIDGYLDAVPRAAADVEAVGPFTLFVKRGPGWPYYARPTPGASTTIRGSDVEAVRGRQRALGVPEEFEWIEELVPEMAEAARVAGLAVHGHPLMHLPEGAFRPAPAPTGFEVRIVRTDDDLDLVSAVARVGFGAPGVDRGLEGAEALPARAREVDPALHAFVRDRLEHGLTVTAAAFADGVPVAVGGHQPVGAVTEVVGVATLPAFRRRGLAAAVTSALVEDARSRDVETVFLSAGDAAIAGVYARLGFEAVGSAGAAQPPG